MFIWITWSGKSLVESPTPVLTYISRTLSRWRECQWSKANTITSESAITRTIFVKPCWDAYSAWIVILKSASSTDKHFFSGPFIYPPFCTDVQLNVISFSSLLETTLNVWLEAHGVWVKEDISVSAVNSYSISLLLDDPQKLLSWIGNGTSSEMWLISKKIPVFCLFSLSVCFGDSL